MRLRMETETIEYKKSTGELKEACVSIAAMLNKHGVGTVYFGVKPNGIVCGQMVSESTLRDVSRAVFEMIHPQVYPTIEKIVLDDRDVVRVEVNGEEKPYSCQGKYYLRTADEDREMSPAELKRVFSEMEYRDSWEKKLTAFSIKDIDKNTVRYFRDRAVKAARIPNNRITAENLIKQIGLCADGYLNEAGDLLFGKNKPLGLKLAIFATNEKLTFLDQNVTYGNLYQLLREAENYILKNIRWKSEIDSLERIEIPEIPVAVVREVLANSFAHARYGTGMDHEICIHPGMITVYNPGSFASSNTPKDYIRKNLPSVMRNRLIAKTLYLSKDIESFGSGFKRIDSYCRDAGVKYSYVEMGNGFKFVLYRNSDIKNVTKDVTKDVTKNSLTKTEQSVYEVIKQTPTITRDEIAERIAKTVRTVQRSLNALRDKGYIDREGNRTKGLWIILK